MKATEITNIIKSADNSVRQEFVKVIRTDQEIWNAINGFGEKDPHLAMGRIQGLVKSGTNLLANANVHLENAEGQTSDTVTDSSGFFKFDMAPGSWNITVTLDGYNTNTASDISNITTQTTTINIEMTANV